MFLYPYIFCKNTSNDILIRLKTLCIQVCIIGLVFSVLLMNLVWQRFRQTPTVTTIESTTFPIFSLNFPAVSICNYNKVYKPHADKFSEDM